MLKCKSCKYFTDNGQGLCLCTRDESWEPTGPDRNCVFLPEPRELRCEDCWRLGNDFACCGVDPKDSAYTDGHLCIMFEDRREDDLDEILSFWKSCGLYDRERINRLLDEVEEAYADLEEQDSPEE